MPEFVFVSYARADAPYVTGLVGLFEQAGLAVWYDAAVLAGDTWRSTIQDRIERCAAVVVVMSPESRRSRWVEREILWAEREGKPIIFLLLAGDVWIDLHNYQYEDVRDGRLPSERVVRVLREHTGTPESVGSGPTPAAGQVAPSPQPGAGPASPAAGQSTHDGPARPATTAPVEPAPERSAEDEPTPPEAEPAQDKPMPPEATQPAQDQTVPSEADRPPGHGPTPPPAERSAEDESMPPEATQPAENEPVPPRATRPAEDEPGPPEATQPAGGKPVPPQATQPAEDEPRPPQARQPAEDEPRPPEATQPAGGKPVPPRATQPTDGPRSSAASPAADGPASAGAPGPAVAPAPGPATAARARAPRSRLLRRRAVIVGAVLGTVLSGTAAALATTVWDDDSAGRRDGGVAPSSSAARPTAGASSSPSEDSTDDGDGGDRYFNAPSAPFTASAPWRLEVTGPGCWVEVRDRYQEPAGEIYSVAEKRVTTWLQIHDSGTFTYAIARGAEKDCKVRRHAGGGLAGLPFTIERSRADSPLLPDGQPVRIVAVPAEDQCDVLIRDGVTGKQIDGRIGNPGSTVTFEHTPSDGPVFVSAGNSHCSVTVSRAS